MAIPIEGGQCRRASGVFQDQAAPSSIQVLAPGTAFHLGDTLYFTVNDGDRNADATVRDSVEVTVRAGENDQETLRLLETGVNTGLFAGALATRATPPSAAPFDCVLSVGIGSRVSLHYADARNTADTTQTEALIDPFGVTFDSETGEVLNGVRVTLVEDASGRPAAVFGDDGVSPYPSSVVSGETVRDAGGAVYPGVAGHYRFPLLASGRYRLVVEAPADYRAPSTAEPASLRGSPLRRRRSGDHRRILRPSLRPSWASPPARGPAARPDPQRPDPGKERLGVGASAGDFVQYRLSLQNPNPRRPLAGAVLTDTLPAGLRFQPASLKVNGRAATAVAQGRTLRVQLGALEPGARTEVSYVVQVDPAVREGLLVNRASVETATGPRSNEARATVRITAPLMTGVMTLIGRVTEGACGVAGKGVPGVRVLLEDGAYVITDKDGLYHFEGVRAGMHVVQLDVARLPEGLEPLACTDANRAAGRPFSQFVDAGGGALWRGDFRLRRTAAGAAASTVKPAAPAGTTPRRPARTSTSSPARRRASTGSSRPRTTTRGPPPCASRSSTGRTRRSHSASTAVQLARWLSMAPRAAPMVRLRSASGAAFPSSKAATS
jgi:uncharacterized repeat protein (TIGR01451 family)